MAKKEPNEFDAARKKRRLKIAAQRLKKIIGAALILIFVVAAVYLFVKEDIAGILGDRIAAASSSGASMPVAITGVSVRQTFLCGGAIGVVTDGNFYLYAENGKRLLTFQHGMTNPVAESVGRRFLLYDQGGNKLLVRMRDRILFEKEFEYTIVNASLSADGWLTVVTTAQRYASQLHVWDENYDEEIFTWSCSDEFILCADAFSEGKTVAAATLSANATGQIVTNVHQFTTEAALELSKRQLTDTAAIDLCYDDEGNVKLVGDTETVLLDGNGRIIGETTYPNRRLVGFYNPAGVSGAALVFDRYTEARATDILFLGEGLEQKKTSSVSGKYLCASGFGSKFGIYVSGVLSVFDLSGEKTAALDGEQDALLVQLTEESVFAVTRDEICEISQ